MLENLKNQERLSPEEERRIDRSTRILILAMTGVVAAVILWAVITKKPFGSWYYALIIALLAAVWLVKCVLATFRRHALAGRTDEQVSAYLKAAGLELASYAGLAWFLIGMNGNGIFGAMAYVFGISGARKQREIYEGRTDASETDTSGALSEGTAKADAPDMISEAAVDTDAADVLPTAADRAQREETDDGSV